MRLNNEYRTQQNKFRKRVSEWLSLNVKCENFQSCHGESKKQFR